MYHIIVNGRTYGEKERANVNAVEQVFKRAGKEYEIHITEYPRHATDITASLTQGGKFAHLIAMGGDGTLHEVLNGIENVENCTLGLIPAGTANDFANAIGVPSDVTSAAENIVFRAPSYIDFIEFGNGLRSINAVGCGIDVDVLKRAYAKKEKGNYNYYGAFIKSLLHYKATTFKVSYDGGEIKEHKGLLVCLGNGKQIGGGIKLFPDAEIDDGYLDLLIVDYLSRIQTLFAFIKLNTGKVNRVKRVTHVKCKSVSFEPVSGCPTIQAEGELYDNIQLSAHIVSEKLKFYLPKK